MFLFHFSNLVVFVVLVVVVNVLVVDALVVVVLRRKSQSTRMPFETNYRSQI